ncbi:MULTISPECIES: hypothetical protein [Pseudoalteromonas]|uniref:Uncharacterized protein n=1 Tax=Pseudoalteromonas amylolytica TaxID=1859457 RepID=A0A1S1MVV0_9GAMM|nr:MULTISPECIES: hypothetical protein [Pseudoalteromonas]OHU85490.1 hypothetical protein BFC16_19265 [Pseudoalteromonas sp. JW3]OHU91724.1 hypothetical protein BET10_07960 [Pseudoalteromonas amylolytica]
MEPVTIALGLAKLTGLDKKIGKWIGGDNGAEVASRVVDMAQTLTGESDPSKAVDRVSQNPELQHQFRTAVLNKEELLEKIALQNLQSARDMQKEALKQDDLESKRFIYRFSWFWAIAASLYVAAVTFLKIPEGSERFADTALGFILATALGGMFNFFYGSSQGSKEKTDKLLRK